MYRIAHDTSDCPVYIGRSPRISLGMELLRSRLDLRLLLLACTKSSGPVEALLSLHRGQRKVTRSMLGIQLSSLEAQAPWVNLVRMFRPKVPSSALIAAQPSSFSRQTGSALSSRPRRSTTRTTARLPVLLTLSTIMTYHTPSSLPR